VGSGCT